MAVHCDLAEIDEAERAVVASRTQIAARCM